MIIRINGQELIAEPTIQPTKKSWKITNEPTVLEKALGYAKPLLMAGVFAIPKDAGVATQLMPLALKLQEFALPAAICVSLWGLVMYIFGDPGGKEKIRQALIGFIGVFVLPMLFFTIWQAFRG